MKLESNDETAGEPDGGWVTSEPLIDTQILELVLCRFTGDKMPIDNICPHMEAGRHPDVDCRSLYLQVEALGMMGHAGAQFPEAQEELRSPFPMGEVIGTTHL